MCNRAWRSLQAVKFSSFLKYFKQSHKFLLFVLCSKNTENSKQFAKRWWTCVESSKSSWLPFLLCDVRLPSEHSLLVMLSWWTLEFFACRSLFFTFPNAVYPIKHLSDHFFSKIRVSLCKRRALLKFLTEIHYIVFAIETH